mmetsp:Transcript_12902/g.27955  ORF Transcript_12902/g.27955 Transcript_12902/m.27955 type:complete len:195 (+) Transcript_12902:867-1451(+)
MRQVVQARMQGTSKKQGHFEDRIEDSFMDKVKVDHNRLQDKLQEIRDAEDKPEKKEEDGLMEVKGKDILKKMDMASVIRKVNINSLVSPTRPSKRQLPVNITSDMLQQAASNTHGSNNTPDTVLDEMVVAAFNCHGYKRGVDLFSSILQEHKVDTCILCETWDCNDLEVFKYGHHKRAMSTGGRPSGGQYIGSN